MLAGATGATFLFFFVGASTTLTKLPKPITPKSKFIITVATNPETPKSCNKFIISDAYRLVEKSPISERNPLIVSYPIECL